MKANLDEIFFAGTEKVGQSFDLETHLVILIDTNLRVNSAKVREF